MGESGRLLVGTAGYSYKDWQGPFYPVGMRQTDYLPYYAERFPLVEIDYTYYRQPSPKTMENMAGRVPPGFRFAVKAHRTITHEVPESGVGQEMRVFMDGVEPMAQRGALGCILYQFPWGFAYSPRNLDYVTSLAERVPIAPAVAEFRNVSWARDDVYAALRGSGVSFCCVDEPPLRGLFPPVVLSTAAIGYVRFHGRNSAKWWNHKEAWERYDYLYTDLELAQWIPKIRDLSGTSEEVYVLFNNCHRGQAAVNAMRLQALLAQASMS